MLLLTTIQLTVISITVLLLVIYVFYLVLLRKRTRNEHPPINANKALWCIRNDPRIARIVLNLAQLEKGSKAPARRRKIFLILELRNQLQHYISEKEELQSVCRRLIYIAISISKMRDNTL